MLLPRHVVEVLTDPVGFVIFINPATSFVRWSCLAFDELSGLVFSVEKDRCLCFVRHQRIECTLLRWRDDWLRWIFFETTFTSRSLLFYIPPFCMTGIRDGHSKANRSESRTPLVWDTGGVDFILLADEVYPKRSSCFTFCRLCGRSVRVA